MDCHVIVVTLRLLSKLLLSNKFNPDTCQRSHILADRNDVFLLVVGVVLAEVSVKVKLEMITSEITTEKPFGKK